MTNALTMDMMPEIDRFYITLQFEASPLLDDSSHGLLQTKHGWFCMWQSYSLANASGIIRASKGSWIGSFSRSIGHNNSMAAKLWGLRNGLESCTSRLMQKQRSLLTSHGYSSSDSSHLCSTLIINCRSLIQFFQETHIYLTYFEKNQYMDLLAKEGSFICASFILYSHSPFYILYQLYDDAWGVSYRRL